MGMWVPLRCPSSADSARPPGLAWAEVGRGGWRVVRSCPCSGGYSEIPRAGEPARGIGPATQGELWVLLSTCWATADRHQQNSREHG